MSHTEKLVREKFHLAFTWGKDAGKLEIRPVDKGLRTTENVVIAFVLNDRVMYVGRSTRNLQEFAKSIRNAAGSQVTNLRLRPHILEALSDGQRVDIWVKVEPEATLSELNEIKRRLNREFLPTWKA